MPYLTDVIAPIPLFPAIGFSKRKVMISGDLVREFKGAVSQRFGRPRHGKHSSVIAQQLTVRECLR